MLARILIIGTAFLLLLSSGVTAQQDVTDHSFTFSDEPAKEDIESGLAPGDTVSGFVTAVYCWKSPGLNPNSGEVRALLTFDGDYPSWLTVAPADDALKWVAGGSSYATEDKCSPAQKWEVKHSIADGAPWGAETTINWTVTVEQDDDIGTYKQIDDTTASGQIRVVVEEEVCDAVTGICPSDEDNGNDDTNGGGGSNPDAEESPAFAPMLAVIALALVAALRRRS